MKYGIRLSWNNGQENFEFPINPGEIELREGGNGKTYDVMGIGEINVIQNPQLPEYSFSGFFPNPGKRVSGRKNLIGGYVDHDPLVTSNTLMEPKIYIEYILNWMRSKRPIRFEFMGDSFNLNTPASIEKFDWKEVAGSGGDIEYSITLKKYEFYAAQKVKVDDKGTKKPEPARANDQLPPAIYTLKAGDSLWKVAKLLLGSGERWGEIQKLNGIANAQLKKLPIGMVLKIPQGAAAHA
ncbi:LysM peptidoglycan-binding domain-containing protein [Paenibacillus nasutitermitis]|uniref:Peptidoglycan-binding protein LysM n=1 Tax=Paenibacillus nasutitermitis TaxID=1652958 RepID=A0A916ZGV6_9BACL|nr:LysM peptidoglycan-binding domain-containing protein [Paenibacillus nasutitermitis]GGD95164.1 peptidoglycan-binding protein LysM [Paenibacillus nasutitermitis]